MFGLQCSMCKGKAREFAPAGHLLGDERLDRLRVPPPSPRCGYDAAHAHDRCRDNHGRPKDFACGYLTVLP